MKKIVLLLTLIFLIADAQAQCNITGNITGANPSLPGMRLFRDGNASSCSSPKLACPGQTAPMNVYYATHSITNGSGVAQTIDALVNVDPVNCTGANQMVFGLYNASFDPFNVCTNYIADLGSSPNSSGNFCFNMPAGATYEFVVMMVNNGATCLGTGYSINICSALPVNLTSFKGRLLSENTAGLFWQTSSESNSSHFEVQRKLNNGEYININKVSTGANSNEKKDYTFYDNQLPIGHLYYRLKQVDNDGAYTYSDIVHINNLKANTATPYLLSNIINQGGDIQVYFPNKYDASHSQVSIYSALGNRIKHAIREVSNKQLALNTNGLTPGVYIIKITEDAIVKKLKFVIN